ncbi:hypothetical protein SI65_04546 [Aspergillus cristatus]|uniref:Uncharacterized protein n=1 Tax=Aspergillus cristatus TaxID=573508 RepID=A0A1E3BFK3_ASPCR|nr:hypothetical protein SI65_04546 [Aspergillus cristatus]
MLLLVSGRSNQDQQHVTFGFFYPKGFLSKRFDEEIKARMFQLEPVQRYFTDYKSKAYSIQFELEDEISTMMGQVTWQDKSAPAKENNTTSTEMPIIKHNVMSLTVDSKGLGHFMVQAHNLLEVDEHFDVDAVELVRSEKQRIFVADFDYGYSYNYYEDDYIE